MKKSLLITGSLILSLGVVGCSNNTSTNQTEQTDIIEQQNETANNEESANSKIDAVKSLLESEEVLPLMALQQPSAKDFYIFENVKDLIIDGVVSQAAINVKMQDVMVIETSDVDSITKVFEDYLSSDAIRPFKDGYGGEDNIEAVTNAIIGNKGNYVYLIAAQDASTIENKILEVLE